MCFDPNARISGVSPSDFGYDVRLSDGTVGNVANSPSDPYYDEVQSYLAKTAPQSPTNPNPAPAQPTGKMKLSSIAGENGGAGVRSIAGNDAGGRYGIGTSVATDREGLTRNIDKAPPTAGNIAQAFGNAIGLPGSAITAGLTQGQSLSDGFTARAVNGLFGGGGDNGPAKDTSFGGATADARRAGAFGDRGMSKGAENRSVGPKMGQGATASARAAGAFGDRGSGNRGTRGGIQGGGGGQRTSDGGRARF